jgi:hypothetical protein
VGALAVFKGLAFVTLFPLVLFAVPDGAAYRPFLLASPTGWIVEAFSAFLERMPETGAKWALGATVYAIVLLAVVVRRFEGKVYRIRR